MTNKRESPDQRAKRQAREALGNISKASIDQLARQAGFPSFAVHYHNCPGVRFWHLSEVELAGIAVSLTPGPRIWVTQSNRARAPCGWQASRRDRETLLASLGHRDPLLPSGTW